MSGETQPRKWHLCEVHHSSFPEPPYYISLPQYGPWDDEREAQRVRELLTRLEPQELIVREYPDLSAAAIPKVAMDSIATSGENSPPDLHDTTRKHYEEPIRWQSRVQHD